MWEYIVWHIKLQPQSENKRPPTFSFQIYNFYLALCAAYGIFVHVY